MSSWKGNNYIQLANFITKLMLDVDGPISYSENRLNLCLFGMSINSLESAQMKYDKKLKTRGPAQEQYEQAVEVDKENIFGGIRAPGLFNWFVGLVGIVVGLSLNLFPKLSTTIESGRFAAWSVPMLFIFVLAGVGLLLSETVEKKGRRAGMIFRLILASTFGALAILRFAGADYEGTFLAVWLAGVILFNVVADMSSLRSYFVFFFGLFVGLPLVAFYSPASQLSIFLGGVGERSAFGFVLFCLSVAYVVITSVSYFRNKQVFTYLIAVAGLPLVGLAYLYANESDWVRAFLILMTGLFAFLLPFWDELRFRLKPHRNWVAGMFAVLLGLFLTTLLLIKVLQNILISNAYSALSDKVTYGRILVEATINNTFLSVQSLAKSEVLVRALSGKRESELVDLSAGFFEGNPNLLRIVAVDARGVVLSAYPLTLGLVGRSLANEGYFSRPFANGVAEVSNVFSAPALEFSESTVAISVPVESGGRQIGMLIGFLDLRSLGDSLQEIATPEQNQVFVLMDSSLNWLTGPETPGGKLSGDPVIVSLRQKGIVKEGYGQDGEYILAAGSNVTPVSWRLILIQPMFSVLAVNQTAYIVTLSITSLAVLVIGITVLLERVGSARHENE